MNNAEMQQEAQGEPRPQNLGAQSAISTKLLLALGFITITAIVAGAASILALNRFQDNYDLLVNNELPTLQDTSHINQLSVTLANRGASLIISPNTWTRENIMGQVDDDAQWLTEILARVSNEGLSVTRKRELLDLKELLFNTYNTLNTLTENRIMFAERLDVIDQEVIQLQQDLVSVQFSTNLPDGAFVPSGPLHQWNETFHAVIFNLMQGRSMNHEAPLNRLEEKITATMRDIYEQKTFLPAEAQLDAEDLHQRLLALTTGSGGLFAIKRADINALRQIDATLRRARTIAERFMSTSELATNEVRDSITAANLRTSRSMDVTLQAMVAFILVSALVAVATFFYVNRTVLRRLVDLRRSMVAHAEGTSNEIDTSGDDEISDMARALQYLVDTLNSRELGLRAAKEEAENASTAKTRFLAAASHDLRQPLQALNLFVYALDNKETDAEKREIILLIRNSLDSLKELLNTLLDISKLEAGVVQTNMKDFSAGAMLERIKSELTAVAWASDLEFRIVDSSVMVYSDPSLLETIVRNLVDNAIKYTERGRVLVGCRHRNGRVRFEVWDTGPGVPADQRELIFQDFYQVDNEARRRAQGLGLGLSIVRRMSELLGCTIGCDSWPGKGSAFWVEVPVSYMAPAKLPRPAEEMRFGESGASGGRHILLIEDDEQVLTGLSSLLEGQGHTVTALHEATRERIAGIFAGGGDIPDLVIADYRLEAKTTGREAIMMIRDAYGRDIPAIILTGDTAPERLREAKQSGFPILHKPVRPEELIATMAQALSEASRQGEDAPAERAVS